MWNYTEKVMDHFLNPRNVGEIKDPDGQAEVGNISCGDALRLTFKLDDQGRIADVKFKTFGCGSAIASSSILTEMVKGMTIEEALKITNKDIADALGGMPEEKMHCSVMGMEALRGAIANFRGEAEAEHDETDHQGRVVCHCFGVTDAKIRKIAKDNQLRTVDAITNYTKAGGACGRCREEIQEILNGVWKVETPVAQPETASRPAMSAARKIIMINDIIEKEIRPRLETDGGSIELVDIVDDKVQVRLKGRCASCQNSRLTLQRVVEDKLRELVSPTLSVEEVK